MNSTVSKLKSAINDPETRSAAVSKLRKISVGRNEQAADARLVLQELGLSCTESVQEPLPDSDPASPNYFAHLFLKMKEGDRKFYTEARTKGWNAEQTIAEVQRQNVGAYSHSGTRYLILVNHGKSCAESGHYIARSYYVPQIRRILEETKEWSAFNWPTIELAESLLARYDVEPPAVEQPLTIQPR